MVMNEMGYRSYWTREQDVAFETALADYPGGPDDQAWEKIATDVPGKTVEELKRHYEILVEDVNNIVSGHVPIPCYTSPSPDGADLGDEGGGDEMRRRAHDNSGGKGSKADRERRKGVAWTENEHKLFLLGLDKYGKGDWRSISRNYVISRTATQVASHAQKYFKRLNSKKMIKRRTSIHDITSAGTGEISASQVPNAGQGNGPIGTGEKSSQQSYQPSGGGPVIGMYGTTIRQQVGGSIITAMGTPVNGAGLPSHIAYEVRAPVSRSVIPGAPVSMPPVPYHILPNTYTI